MKNKITLFMVLYSVLGLTSACSDEELYKLNYMSGQAVQYDKFIETGFDAITSQDYIAARESFQSALSAPRDEEPNYEAYLPLAFAECKLGNRSTAQAMIKDFSCMLQVDAGIIQCPSAELPSTFVSHGGTTHCNAVMCGELFLPYYSNLTNSQRTKIQLLRNDLNRVSEQCD